MALTFLWSSKTDQIFKEGHAHSISKLETLNYTRTLNDFQGEATSLWASEEVGLRPLHSNTMTLLIIKITADSQILPDSYSLNTLRVLY